MGGFWAWVAGPQGTLALTACALTFGVIAGWLAARAPRPVSRRVRRELADRAAARAAGRGTHQALLLDSKPPEDRFAAIREAGRNAWAIQQQRAEQAAGPWRNPCPVCGAKQPPCEPGCGFRPDDEELELRARQAHEAWVAHCEQAEDIANGDPAVDVLDVIHADLDRFIASIRAEAGQ